jgi:nucleotide-binding universal stress UspA family protein
MNMSGIVCAVRGGPNCKSTLAQAIALAQNTHLSLHFLYVVNHDLLPESDDHIHAAAEKMHQMGQAVLSVAENKAATRGIVSETTVCQGNVEAEILNLCRDLDADYVILGRPEDQREAIFTRDSLEILGQQIESEVGAKVILPNCKAQAEGTSVKE